MAGLFARHMDAELAGDLETTLATMTDNPHWDQASVLVQLGLLDPAGLPVAGRETVAKLLDPALPCPHL
jgi:hypothetical protein